MATTATLNVRDIVTRALRKAGIVAFGENASDDDAEVAMAELDMMLKHWQNMGYNLWTKTSGTHTVTAGAEQTLTPVRPLRILSARYKSSATASELVMTEMMRDEYDSLPVKTTTGTPTQFYYDRQREAARLYIWPVLATATGETIEYTYEREIEDVTSLDEVIDVPGEWWDTTVYNLAARLIEMVPVNQNPMITQRAQIMLMEAGAFDREGSVFFAGEYSE